MSYKREKANRIERAGWEKYQYAKQKLDKAINGYINRKLQATPKTIDFTAENLNQEIAKIRKEFKPDLESIKKAFSGSHKGRKKVTYYLDFEKLKFELRINEFGSYTFHPFNVYNNLKKKSFVSVSEIINQLKSDIKNIIKCLNKSIQEGE